MLDSEADAERAVGEHDEEEHRLAEARRAAARPHGAPSWQGWQECGRLRLTDFHFRKERENYIACVLCPSAELLASAMRRVGAR